MHRILLCVSLCFLTTGLCACQAEPEPPVIKAATDSDVTIERNGVTYEGHLTYVNEETAALTLTAPETLRGMSFQRGDGQFTMALDTLQCKSEQALLPDDSVALRVFSFFDALQQPTLRCTGQNPDTLFRFTGDGAMTVTTSEVGEIVSVECGEWRIVMKNGSL